jgi:hypothetical protein
MAESYFRRRARNPYRQSNIAELYAPQTPTFDEPMSPAITAPQPLDVVLDSPESPTPASIKPRSTGRELMEMILAQAGGDPVERERAAYESQVPTTTKGRIVEALKSAGIGALQAAARNPRDPLGAAIGGAAAAGGISAVSPKTGRAFQFESVVRPGIEERERRAEAQRQRQRQAEADELKRRETMTDIELKRSQAEKNRRPEAPARAINPYRWTPAGRLNTITGEIDPSAIPPKERTSKPITFEGVTYDYNDPVDRERLERAQARLPRDSRGRYISRSDERASAPKAARQPRKEFKGYVSMDKIRKYMADNNVSESQAITDALNDGYRVAGRR